MNRSRFAALIIAVIAALGTFDTGSFSLGAAHAIIGRPLTPLSVAGVARRTTRRAVYGYGAGVAPYAYGAGVYGSTLAALPYGCQRYTVTGALYYGCNGTYYQPQYDGPDVVYVQVEKP
jgi:hypothetical protein